MTVVTLARKGFARIFDVSKEEVILNNVTIARSDQDDLTYTPHNSSEYAKIERGGLKDVASKAGDIGDADLAMEFPYTVESGLDVSNFITYASKKYQITRVQPYNLGEDLIYTRVYLKETGESV